MSEELDRIARAIIDGNRYMVLGTADQSGRPWVSPVYYAPSGYAELYWLSSPEAQHSRNLAVRPELSVVVFDPQAQVGKGQGVYMSAVAERLAGVDAERGIEIFSRVSVSHGARPWDRRGRAGPGGAAPLPGARVRALGPRPGAPAGPADPGPAVACRGTSA